MKSNDDYQPENIHVDYMEEMNIRKGEGEEAHSMAEDKLFSKASADVQEKTFEKKSSLKILDSFDGKSSISNSNQLKKIAITKNILNRLKDTKVGGLEGIMPATKTPFNFSISSKTNINSFYKRTAFINSFNKDDSASFSRQEFSRQDSLGMRASPMKVGPGTLTGNEIGSIRSQQFQDYIKSQQIQESLKSQGQIQDAPKSETSADADENEAVPDETPTIRINDFMKDKLTLSRKIKSLNEKTYEFAPSLEHHRSLRKAAK